MQYQWNRNNFSDLRKTFFIKNRSSYIKSMSSSDCNSQRINTGTFHKFHSFCRICIRISFCFQIIFFAAHFSQFCFHRDTFQLRCLNHLCGNCNISFQIFLGSVNHNRCVTIFHTLHCQFITAAMIQMQTYRYRSFLSICSYDCCIRFHCTILNRRWGCLKHNRCL